MAKSTSELLKEIEKAFFEKLMKKTGWGRNEIMKEYASAVREILMDNLD